MAEYVHTVGIGNCNNKVFLPKKTVSVAQVLSALELAMVIDGDSRGGGCSDDSS